MNCEVIKGTVVPEGKLICFMSMPFLGKIDSPCDALPDGTMPKDDAGIQMPFEALALQEVEFDHGRRFRPWWDFMNDPDHPSRRKPRPRKTDEMSCGPGGCMALYWYWIGCPSPDDVRPKTPAFYDY